MKRLLLKALMLLAAAPMLSGQAVYEPEEIHKKAPAVPQFVVFAGDTVRFDRQDFYERMDRELISFTYMHTNTTLMLKRSARYFTIVEPILREQGIPEDFKYLMAIESNLDPRALSPAGAAGIWQVVRSTAQAHGLEVSSEVDERYNVEKETVVACEYFNAAQRQDTALELWMAEETSRYIFRLLAAKMLFENPAAFGFDVTPADMYPYIPPRTVVTVSGPVPSLVDFAEEHGATYAALKEANLWLRSDKLTNKSGRTYRIAIP